jgi:tRNA modification GTPase
MKETIVAVSSPRGTSARAIVRLSGPEAIPCAEGLFMKDTSSNSPSEAGRPGYCCQKGRLILTEGLEAPAFLYIMRAPASYTREDVAELHTLGSPPLVEMVLAELFQKAKTLGRALRWAQPGEFTKRAFLNGRLDLAQAEAVLQVIRSRSDAELRLAMSQLEGGLSRILREAQERLADILSLLEVSIDFSDQDIGLLCPEETDKELETLAKRLSGFTQGIEMGKVSREGIRATFCGPPNVGKSSLLNALLGRPRAITSPLPGTTRDPLEAELVLGDISFSLVDTAGLALPSPELVSGYGGLAPMEGIEGLAVARAQKVLESSELALLVLDGSIRLEPQALEFINKLKKMRRILVINKSDLPQRLSLEDFPSPWREGPTIHTSALTGRGLEELKQEMIGMVMDGGIDSSASPALLNSRQRLLLGQTLESLRQAGQALREGLSQEFAALSLREALDNLGELSGGITNEDILDRIFSRFCIGK